MMVSSQHNLWLKMLAALFLVLAVTQAATLANMQAAPERDRITFSNTLQKGCQLHDFAELQKHMGEYLRSAYKRDDIKDPAIQMTYEYIYLIMEVPAAADAAIVSHLRQILTSSAVRYAPSGQESCYPATYVKETGLLWQRRAMAFLRYDKLHRDTGMLHWLSLLLNLAMACALWRRKPDDAVPAR